MKRKVKSNVVRATKMKTRSAASEELLVENILNNFHQLNCSEEDDRILRVFKSHSVKSADRKTVQDLVKYDENGLFCCFSYFTKVNKLNKLFITSYLKLEK